MAILWYSKTLSIPASLPTARAALMHANASTGSTLESLIGPFGDSGRYAVSSSVSDLSFRCKATSFRIGVPMRKFRTITAPLYLLLLCAGYCIAQTAAPDSSASISGRVTIGGKGAAGITVAATVSNPSGYDRTVAKIVTDEEGNYRRRDSRLGFLRSFQSRRLSL